jgi:hypothetical protein
MEGFILCVCVCMRTHLHTFAGGWVHVLACMCAWMCKICSLLLKNCLWEIQCPSSTLWLINYQSWTSKFSMIIDYIVCVCYVWNSFVLKDCNMVITWIFKVIFTPNIIPSAHHTWLYKCTICAIQNIFKVSSVVARNANKAMVGSGGCLESGSQFCVRTFGRNLASGAMKIFHI